MFVFNGLEKSADNSVKKMPLLVLVLFKKYLFFISFAPEKCLKGFKIAGRNKIIKEKYYAGLLS